MHTTKKYVLRKRNSVPSMYLKEDTVLNWTDKLWVAQVFDTKEKAEDLKGFIERNSIARCVVEPILEVKKKSDTFDDYDRAMKDIM